MKKSKAKPKSAELRELRSRAEARLKKSGNGKGGPGIAAADSARVVHELRVHQVELELQNHELERARVQTESALAWYTELFDYAPVGYVTLDDGQMVREMNHVGARILGIERRRVVGTHFLGYVASTDRDAFLEVISAARKADARTTRTFTLWRRPHEAFSALVTVSFWDRGSTQFLVAFEDVTEQKNREERLVRAEEELREADRRKDDFLATLSHELRNPLAPIKNSLYLLARTGTSSPEAERARAVIDRQVVQMTRLIDDLLDVTRIRKGRSALQLEKVELGALARRTIEDHRVGFENAGLHLLLYVEGGPHWVDGDAARLVQVISNLLGNAKKFTLPGGRVTATLTRDDERAVLKVKDTGVGIEATDLGHMFEPFSQARQPLDRTKGGLGLGLAMVKGFIEMHSGSVDIASEGLGHGTEVTLRLPLAGPPAEAPAKQPAKPVPRRKVLVIEDNVDCADTLKEALAMADHDVRVAYDGPSGLAIARGFHPEIVICDIGLPDMDGYEVARAFRAEQALRGAYLVALSGYARLEDRRQAALAGFNQHVAKPPNLEALERLLGEAPVGTG